MHAENDVRQAKVLGLDRWPSRQWAINKAWTQTVVVGREPARLRPALALDHELHDAAPKLLRFRFLYVPARLTRGQRKRWLHLRADWPATPALLHAWTAVKALSAPT